MTSSGVFPFPDLNSYLPNDPSSTLSTTIPTTYTPHTNLPSPLYTSFNPTPYPGQKHHLPSPTTSPSSAPSQEPETAASRLAAEEDKRRRNTAASARFRVKKKQREQALEQTAKDLESKAKGLEQRIGQLETENEWLRGLVVEKRGGEREELRLRWKGEGGVEAERRVGEGRKGVGTDGGENV